MVRLSDEARDLWTEFAARHGVSVSALLEAMALSMTARADTPLTPEQRAVIEEARAIDVERRRRG